MKVYISVDIEGVAGVIDRSQGMVDGGHAFELGRALMMGETNAAIEGALAAGATEIVVNDSHAVMRNLLPTQLHPKATLIQGRIKNWFMVEGLDETFDAVMLVGYHAPAGVRDGVLNHAFHPLRVALQRAGLERDWADGVGCRTFRRAGRAGDWRRCGRS